MLPSWRKEPLINRCVTTINVSIVEGHHPVKGFVFAMVSAILLSGIPASVTTAGTTEPEILERECHRQLQLGPRGCTCIRERAKDILNEKQQRMVVALVMQDLAASDEMQSQLTTEEMAGAANFMMSAPQDCAEQ